MNSNGRPRKSKRKKSSRLVAIEDSFNILFEIAKRDRSQDDELDEDEKAHKIIENMDEGGLPLDQETAEFFLPDDGELAFVLEALAEGPFDFLTTLASLKAQNFMHGYIHAQIEDGKRSKDGSLL